MDKRLKEILIRDPRKNIATIGFFENFPVKGYFFEGDSVLIYGTSDNFWTHLVSSSEKELRKLLEKHFHKTNYYYSVEDWMIPILLKFGKEDWVMTTNRYILNSNISVEPARAEIIKVDVSYASFIHENSDYKKFTSIEYIEQRLNAGISAGILVNNHLIAWGFTHDDGALGFLHVLPEYRKRGYANEVVLSLIHQRRQANKTIFCNIVPENSVAKNFVTGLGFHFDRKVSWVKLK
ncbi:MAG: GNAT family N-acetyltransferase [Chloroflexia bacterium]|nr:GNAT family N-acetyltransferase [Chloroflexia bacterium]